MSLTLLALSLFGGDVAQAADLPALTSAVDVVVPRATAPFDADALHSPGVRVVRREGQLRRLDNLQEAPRPGAAVDAARGFLMDHGLLEAPVRAAPRALGGAAGPDGYGPGGAVVRFHPERDGLPVDAHTAVRLDALGRVRQVVFDPIPDRRVEGPTLPLGRALTATGLSIAEEHVRARLSWQPDGPVLRKVWTVDVPLPHPSLSLPRLRIDAVTGALLAMEDAAAHRGPIAWAYAHNPILEEHPSQVSLPLAADGLDDARLEVRQCRDLQRVRTQWVGDTPWDLHVCTEVAAEGPVDGAYDHPPIPWPDDPARDEDDFVAAHLYWNVHQGLDWFDALGWTPVEGFDPRLEVVGNQRDTDMWSLATATDPTQPLKPYDNAYFTGGYETWEGEWVVPRLVFGQGHHVDFGYDADVIHHELGHFIVRSQEGPSWSRPTTWGTSVRANSLNEAFADYFSAAIQGDPLLAEYAAGLDGTNRAAIRDLSGDARCDRDLFGQAHADSLPISQALWAFREALAPRDRGDLDRIVLDSLAVMGPNATFEDAASVILALTEERLGAEPGRWLQRGLARRGLFDCAPVIDIVPSDTPFRSFSNVNGSYEWSHLGAMPGFVQFRVEVPEGGARLLLEFEQSEFLGLDLWGSNAPQPLRVVGRAGDRLTWVRTRPEVEIEYEGQTYTLTVDEWASDGLEVADAAHMASQPHPADPRYELHVYLAEWVVREPGPFVFQLTNAHPRSATARNLIVRALPLLPAEPGPGAVTQEPPVACGCSAGGSAPTAAWLLAFAALIHRRRRA